MAARKRDPKDTLKALDRIAGTAKTTRLRKLVCSDGCGYPPLRVSRAAIKLGLPTCVCGAMLWPWDLDDVSIAHESGHLTDREYETHPLVLAYNRELNSVAHGQAWTGGDGSKYNDATSTAAYRVARDVAEQARANQLAAARALQVVEEMPF